MSCGTNSRGLHKKDQWPCPCIHYLSSYLTFDLLIIPLHGTVPVKAVFEAVPNPGNPGLRGMPANTHLLDSRVFDVEVITLLAHASLLSVFITTCLS